jgi:hypothetical protein
VYVQDGDTHDDTNFTWVPYPSDTAWGWLEDPNGQAVAYDSSCGCNVMYTPEDVWWELFQAVPGSWFDVPDAIDSNNNGTDGWCLTYPGSLGVPIGYDVSGSDCYDTQPAADSWAAPYSDGS